MFDDFNTLTGDIATAKINARKKQIAAIITDGQSSLFFNASSITTMVCPSRMDESSMCSGHGTCVQQPWEIEIDAKDGSATSVMAESPTPWRCVCAERYFGEACSFESYCNNAVAYNYDTTKKNNDNVLFVNKICVNPSSAVSVWPYGRDDVVYGGTASMGDIVLSTSSTSNNAAPKPVRSVQRAMDIGFSASFGLRRRALNINNNQQNDFILNVLLYSGLYQGFDVCNVVAYVGRSVRIGSLHGKDRTRIDCLSTGNFMSIRGVGTTVELVGVTMTGGAVEKNAQTGTTSSTSGTTRSNILVVGSLLHVSTQATLLGKHLQMSTGKNTPSLVVRDAGTTVTLYDLSSSQHSDGAIRVEHQASLTLETASFGGNVGTYGGCLHVLDQGTTVVMKHITVNSVQVTEDGGFLSAEHGGHVSFHDLMLSKASAQRGSVIAASYGGIVDGSELRLNDIDAEQRGAFVHAMDPYSKVTLKNITLQNAKSMLGSVISATAGSTVEVLRMVVVDAQSRESGSIVSCEGLHTRVLLQQVTGTNLKAVQSGGVVHALNGSTVLVEDSNFEEMYAYSGGTIYAHGAQTMVSLKRSKFYNSIAKALGGGIHVESHAVVKLRDTEWRKMSVSCDKSWEKGHHTCLGAGIYVEGGAKVLGGNQRQFNNFIDMKADIGAGVVSYGLKNEVTGISFTMLTAQNGAGIYVLQEQSHNNKKVLLASASASARASAGALTSQQKQIYNVQLSHVGFSQSNATENGGILYTADAGSYTKVKDMFVGNVRAKNGGLAYVHNSSVEMEDLSVTNCEAEIYGGLMLVEMTSRVKIRGGTILDVASGVDGGGFYLKGHSFASLDNLQGISFVTQRRGGFAYVTEASELSLTQSSMASCSVQESGGFVHSTQSSRVHLQTSTVSITKSGDVGGSIALYDDSKLLGDGRSTLINTTAVTNGGGIYLDSSNVSVVGVKVKSGLALLGGGIYCDGTKSSLSHVHLVECTGMNGGGGLFLTNNAEVKVSQTTIDRCKSSIGGGCHVTEKSVLTGLEISMRNNTADRGGGAMVEKRSVARMSTLLVIGNRAKNGAGVCLRDEAIGTFDQNSVFEGNVAMNQGGGVMVVGDSSCSLKDSLLLRNYGFYGGALYVDGCAIALSTVEVRDNAVEDGGYGGGLFIAKNGRSNIMKESLFVSNTATKGGAAYVEYGSLFYVEDSTLRANVAQYDGGGVFVNDATALLKDSVVEENMAVDEGGGLNVQNGGNMTAIGTTFRRNTCGGYEETGSGIGSIAVMGRSTSATVKNCDFHDNVALNIGGLFATEAQVIMEASRFYSNSAKEGAGMVLDRTTIATISHTQWYNNVASEEGGGAIVRGEVFATMRDCVIGPNNHAEGNGGGFLLDKLAHVNMIQSRIYENSAVSAGGGLRLQGKATITMRDSIVHANKAREGAGISAVEKTHVDIQASTFTYNNATERGGGIMTTHTNCPIEINKNKKGALKNKVAASNNNNNKDTIQYEVCVRIQSTSFTDNVAGAGGGFFWRYRESPLGPLSSSESRDFTCENCQYGDGHRNLPTGAGTNAMGTRILHYPQGEVETGLQLYGEGVTIQIEVTDRYGLRSTLDDTTVCSITKDPSETGDLGIDQGVAQSSKGVVSFDGIRFLGDGETTYKIVLHCLIDGVIDMSYDNEITVGWCEPGYAPIARICRPCQDRMYSLYGKWCLECPVGGNCTALHRSSDGLPRGVGEPRALPGFWLHTAPQGPMKARCDLEWLDNDGPKKNGNCNPSELFVNESGICLDREWPSFQLHMCLVNVIFYRCPRGPSSCPGNFSMSEVGYNSELNIIANYTSGMKDPQCNVGYSNVICGNCLLGYYPAVADECTRCLQSKNDEVQTKMFYGGLMVFMLFLLGLFIFYYLNDGVLVGKKWSPHVGPLSCCQRCKKGCQEKVFYAMSQGFQIEKFKIALGLFQVFSSFKMTYEIDWPPEVIEWFNQFAIFENLDILKLVAMDCLFKTDYLFSLKFQTLSPLTLVLVVFLLWRNSKYVYAQKLSLYPRVCTECHMPISPFEETPRQRAMKHYIDQMGCCIKIRWRCAHALHRWLKLRPILITTEMFAKAGMHNVPPPDKKVLIEKQNQKKQKNQKKNRTLTAVIPVNEKNDATTTITTSNKNSEELKEVQQASKEAWGKKPKRKLKRKTSLENNFSDNSMTHKYGCPTEGHDHTGGARNSHFKPNHTENSVFNFKMRVKLRMKFRNFKSRCLKVRFLSNAL